MVLLKGGEGGYGNLKGNCLQIVACVGNFLCFVEVKAGFLLLFDVVYIHHDC